MTLESIEKLRKWTKDLFYSIEVKEEFDSLCDEIQAEIDSRYMLLPVDADGVPWHIGDVTENGNTVNAIAFDRIGAHFLNTLNDIDPSIHTHGKPRTVEDVLHDFLSDAVGILSNKQNADWDSVGELSFEVCTDKMKKYAAELRMAGSDDQ